MASGQTNENVYGTIKDLRYLFSQFDGKYFTGDGCRRDKDGLLDHRES